MNTNLITRPLVNIIEDFSSEKPEIKSLYSRVRSVLRKYCESKSIKLSQLSLTDIFSYDNTLNQSLSIFIARLPQPAVRDATRHKRYKEEIRSNLGSMFRKIAGKDLYINNNEQRESFLITNVPDFLKSIVVILPKENWQRRPIKDLGMSQEDEKYKQSSISVRGCCLLRILLEVTEKYQLNTIEKLFSDYRSHVYQTIRTTIPPQKWSSIISLYVYIREKLKIKVPRTSKVSIDIKDLPPTLNKQWKTFEIRALTGWKEDPEMLSLAAQNGIRIRPLERSTLNSYREVLLQALAYIPYKDDLDIRDLLRVQALEVNIDGVLTVKLCNHLLDDYRRLEWQKETKHKRKGFDSSQFVNFICVIKTLAAYNGIFHLQAPLRKNYVCRLDKETRKGIKAAKKRIFPLEWIDKVIANLEPEFIQIIKENRFKGELGKWKFSETRRALRFCFFYISLLTLRFTGFRQQCIRNCVYGKHIVFGLNGTIIFRWEADEIKNDKLFEMSLDPKKHNQSHGILIRSLNLYHNKVYKYLLQRDSKAINEQFFLKLNWEHRPQNFEINACGDFYRRFVSWSRMFINTEELNNELRLFLRPHDYRGLAADWYFCLLNGNIGQTANLLGDSPETIAQEYLRNDQHIVSGDLDEVNRILKQKEKYENDELVEEQILRSEAKVLEANRRADLAEKKAGELLIQLNKVMSLLQRQFDTNQ